MAAIGAMEAGEAGGEIAAAVELVDDGHRVVAQRAVGLAVGALVAGAEIAPRVVDDLPEGRGARSPGLIDGGYELFMRTVLKTFVKSARSAACRYRTCADCG